MRSLLLALGLATTSRVTTSGWGGPIFVVRLRNIDHALNFDESIGFIGERKASLLAALEPDRSAKKDYVYLPRAVWEELAPMGSSRRSTVFQSLRKAGGVARMLAQRIFEELSTRGSVGRSNTSSSGSPRTKMAACNHL